MSEDAYIANKQVSIAGGRQVGAGQIITGDFDPDDPDNAVLIDEGLISASTAPVDPSEDDQGESDAKAPSGGSGDDSASPKGKAPGSGKKA